MSAEKSAWFRAGMEVTFFGVNAALLGVGIGWATVSVALEIPVRPVGLLILAGYGAVTVMLGRRLHKKLL